MALARMMMLLILITVYIGTAEASDCHIKYQQFSDHTACKTKSASAVSREITPTEAQEIVDRHNYWRGQADPPATNMMKLTWDSEIAMIAQKWADACDDRPNYIEHDTQRFVPGRFSVGQNLGDGFDFQTQIDGWHSEKPLYDFGHSFFDQTNDFSLWLHYTLMMWANSYKIGCGAASCGSYEIFVCNYAPMGNTIDFYRPYNTGTQCSDCQTCEDGLCVCGAGYTCDIGQPISSTCGCACADTGGFVPAYLQQPDCRLNCTAGLTDVYMCGAYAGYMQENCAGVHYDCPWMCSVCPHADEDFDGEIPTTTERTTTTTTASAGNAAGNAAGNNSSTENDNSCTCLEVTLSLLTAGVLLALIHVLQ